MKDARKQSGVPSVVFHDPGLITIRTGKTARATTGNTDTTFVVVLTGTIAVPADDIAVTVTLFALFHESRQLGE